MWVSFIIPPHTSIHPIRHGINFAVSTQIFAPNRDGWNIMYHKKCTQKSLYMKINGCAQLLSSFNAIPRPMLYGSAASTRPPPSHLHTAHAALSRAGFETQRLQKSSAASFPPACLPRTRAALASRRPNPPRAATPRAALAARRPNPPRAAGPRAALAARRLNPPCTAAPSCGLRPPPPGRGVCARLASRERALRCSPPCGLRPPPPGPAQGGAGAGHRRRDMRRLRARPPPPSRQPSFRDFRKYFWGFFVLHVGGQIPRDLF